MKDTSEYLDKPTVNEIVAVYAGKGYDSIPIRERLKNKNVSARIPFRKNGKSPGIKPCKKYNSVRYAAEGFFDG